MKLVRNILGMAAGLTVCASMTLGVASAQVSSATSVELLENPTPVGCLLEIYEGENIDFGDFTWDGSVYAGDADPGALTLIVYRDTAPGEFMCPPVYFYGTDLTLNGAVGVTHDGISLNTNVMTYPGPGTILIPESDPSHGAAGVYHNFTVDLSEPAINDDAVPGVYTGTIYFTMASGLD